MIELQSYLYRVLSTAVVWSWVVLVAASARGEGDAGVPWHRDIEKGRIAAKAADKDLMIVFTGRGWCQPCELLNAQIFEDGRFVERTGNDFVFVELDFNFGTSDEDTARKTTYQKAKEKYLIGGFPTIILAGEDGVPYAIFTGYSAELGYDEFVARLQAAHEARLTRDQHFRLAASLNGIDRSKELHEGLQCIVPFLGSMDEHCDDPVLVFYSSQVKEILSDDIARDERQLFTLYEQRKAARDAFVEQRIALKRIQEYKAVKEYDAAAEYIVSLLSRDAYASMRWQLELSRQACLELDGQFEHALTNAQRLLNGSELEKSVRKSLLASEARCLFHLGRDTEAFAFYDQTIASASDPDIKRSLLYEKARWLRDRDRVPESIKVWQAYRETTEPNTFDWLTGTAYLARAYQTCDKHREALAMFDEVVATLQAGERGDIELQWPWSADSIPSILLETAKSHIVLNQFDQVQVVVDAVRAAAKRLEGSERDADKFEAIRLQKETGSLIERVQEQSAAKK